MRAVLACAASFLSSSLPAQVPRLDSVNRYVTAEMKRGQWECWPRKADWISRRPAARQQLGETLQNVGSWTVLGCDPAIGRKIRWLGGDVARICYARGTGETGRTVVTVYYTDDWRAAYFDYENY